MEDKVSFKRRVFVLEDIREISAIGGIDETDDEIILCRSYDEATRIIHNESKFDIWSLDHDLGDEQNRTGLTFLKWAVKNAQNKVPRIGNVRIHSMNPIGAQRMRDFLLDMANIGVLSLT